jgi:hypothetical protein
MESYRILTLFNAMNFENFNDLAFSIINFLVGTVPVLDCSFYINFFVLLEEFSYYINTGKNVKLWVSIGFCLLLQSYREKMQSWKQYLRCIVITCCK